MTSKRKSETGTGKLKLGASTSTAGITDGVEGRLHELRDEILQLQPGSDQAATFFQGLPEAIASLRFSFKEQLYFVAEVCKLAWYNQQGESILCQHIHGKCTLMGNWQLG